MFTDGDFAGEEAVARREEAGELPMLGVRWGLHHCPSSTLPSALTPTWSAPSHPAPTVFFFPCSDSQGLGMLGTLDPLC